MKKPLELFMRILIFINIIFLAIIYTGYYKINGISWIEAIGVVVGCMVIAEIIKVLKQSSYKRVYLIAAVCITLGIIIYNGIEMMNLMFSFIESIHFMTGTFKIGKGISFLKYGRSVLCIIAVFSLFMAFCGIREKKSYLLIFNTALLFILWFSGGAEQVMKILFPWSMIIIGMFMTDRIKRTEGDRSISERGDLIFWIMRVSLAISIVVALIPKGIYGHEFFGLNRVLNNQYAPMKGIGVKYSDVYRFSDTVEKGMKKLGGTVKQGNEKLIEIRGGYVEYLKSSSRVKYDGEYWYNNKVSYKKLKSKRKGKESYGDFIINSDGKVDVSYTEHLSTKTIFTAKNSAEYLIDSVLFYSKEGDSILKREGYINSYSIEKNRLREKSSKEFVPEVLSYFKERHKSLFKYEMPVRDVKNVAWDEYRNKVIDDKNLSYDVSKANKRVLSEYQEYLQVSDSVTPRTVELTKEIVGNETDTLEKLKRIKSYIKDFPYTLDVSEIPENSDFIDYFLFEEKSGYCTYYASTMAIMARIAGIPSRYCEGFKVDADNKLTDFDGEEMGYFVTGKNGHAWVEVLMDPKADIWVVVEATGNESNNVVEELGTQGEADSIVDDGDFSLNIDTLDNELENLGEQQVSTGGKKETELYAIIIAILVGVFILKLLHDSIARVRIKNCNDPKKIYKYVLKRIKKERIIKSDNLSEMEFAHSLDDKEIREMMVNIVEKAYEATYGIKIKYESKDDYIKINEFIRLKRGWFWYYTIRIVTGD